MSRPVGSKNKMTQSIKADIEYAFKRVNGKKCAGLIRLAQEQPAIFYSLVAKCVPNQVALDLKIQLDLGAAMLENEESLKRLNAPTIENVPGSPTKPLKLKET